MRDYIFMVGAILDTLEEEHPSSGGPAEIEGIGEKGELAPLVSEIDAASCSGRGVALVEWVGREGFFIFYLIEVEAPSITSWGWSREAVIVENDRAFGDSEIDHGSLGACCSNWGVFESAAIDQQWYFEIREVDHLGSGEVGEGRVDDIKVSSLEEIDLDSSDGE